MFCLQRQNCWQETEFKKRFIDCRLYLGAWHLLIRDIPQLIISFFWQILKTLPTLTTELTTDNVGPQPPHNSSTTDTKTFHSMDSSNPTESRSTESFHNPDASGFHSLHRSQNFSGSGHDPSERPQLSPSSSEEVSCAPAEESSVVLPVARLLSEFFEDQPDEYFERYLLARKFLRYFWVMDLVERNSMNSCCFTKRSEEVLKPTLNLNNASKKWTELAGPGI